MLHAVLCALFAVLALQVDPQDGQAVAAVFVFLALAFALLTRRTALRTLLRVMAWLQAALMGLGLSLFLVAATIGGSFHISPALQWPALLAGVLIVTSLLAARQLKTIQAV
ncbi:hypothetical protein [Atopomonas sediminilitoris]|uniref:hypothetical protein n=1 Tax=Atopomonas sediminilitoris TaxID=2919919 RepID=UPI001F4E4FC4|nr:hypothetical protein [Atopomonas sediminilitoris]MCJ8169189.1 hypothetical protein [Atopomonas sediminilitoris]